MISKTMQTLANGLRVVVVPMPHLHTAELALYIKAGSRNDPPGKEGLSHFLEHMLFRGTDDFPTSLDIERAFDEIGGAVNASTDEECTCFFSRVHPRHLSRGVEILSSMMLRPLLSGIAIEKRIITEEALDDLNEHGDEINPHNLTSRLLWPEHPLGAPTIGTLTAIDSFTGDDIGAHLAAFYRPTNAVLVAAGNFNSQEFFTAAADHFRSWQGENIPPLLIAAEQQQSPRIGFFPDSDSQAHLQIAFRAFSRSDERIMALRFLRRILCGSGSSRLNLLLREELGIVYSVDASIAAYEETGCFAIELSTAPENLSTAVKEILGVLLDLGRREIPGDELERARSCYCYELEFSRDSCYDMQVRYGWGELMGVARDIDDDWRQAAAVSTEALLHIAASLFSPENLTLVVVGTWYAEAPRQINDLVAGYADTWQRL